MSEYGIGKSVTIWADKPDPTPQGDALTPPIARRLSIIRERIKCEHCSTQLYSSNLSRHLRDNSQCNTIRTRKRIEEGWVLLYQILDWKAPAEINNALRGASRSFQTGYINAGWGRPAKKYSNSYIDKRLAQIFKSPNITDEEKIKCAGLPVDSEEFQGYFALARLAD
jgi:hypothetical protein